MTIWQLTVDDVEAVVTQLRQGKDLKQVADDLGISVEMAACAVRKAQSSRPKPIFGWVRF